MRPFDVWGSGTVYATNDAREEDAFVTNGACKKLGCSVTEVEAVDYKRWIDGGLHDRGSFYVWSEEMRRSDSRNEID